MAILNTTVKTVAEWKTIALALSLQHGNEPKDLAVRIISEIDYYQSYTGNSLEDEHEFAISMDNDDYTTIVRFTTALPVAR